MNLSYFLYLHNNLNKHPMTTQITIESEFKKRTDLIENAEFRAKVAEYCKQIGMTAKDWNENKAGILMMMANEVCGLENKSN